MSTAAARLWGGVRRHSLTVYALLAVAYLMLPIAVVILFSFNKPAGRFNYVWQEFTFQNWLDWDDVLGVNLRGTFVGAREAARAMVARGEGGVIVNISSTASFRADAPGAAHYVASKFGVRGFSQALAAESAGRIGVTNIIPAGMRTAFFEGRTEQYKPGPDAQLIEPEYVANSILFALSQPAGCEIRELSIMPATEPSWP